MATTVAGLKIEAKENSKKIIRVYNPDTEDFTFNYHGQPHTIKALDYGEFSYKLGLHMKKHLIDHLINKRSLDPITQREEVAKEVAFDDK